MPTIDNRIQQFFPTEFLDLQLELQYHPTLCELLQNHPTNELEVRLAEIAAYAGVLLDGEYDGRDLAKLAGILHKKLREARTKIIIVEGKVQ